MEFEAVKYTDAEWALEEPNIMSYLEENVDNLKAVEFGCIKGNDGTVLCPIESRLDGYDFSPKTKEIFSTTDAVYFIQDDL